MWKTRITAILVVLCLSVSVLASEPNLVAHWTFDEGSGTTAYDSAGTNNGTLAGNTAWTTGQIAGALEFDGSGDYVDCGDISAADGTKNLTITAWVNTDSISTQKLISRKGEDYPPYYLWVMSDYTVLFGIYRSYTPYSAQTTEAIAPNEWFFVAGTYDGETVRTYINGEEKAVNTSPAGPTNSNSYSLRIGSGYPEYSTAWFDGRIDDVRIYNRALSIHEIRALYHQLDLCPSNAALYFDGEDDYVVDMGAGSELNFERTDKFALSAWYKGSGPNNTLLSKMDKTTSRYRGYDVFLNGGYVTTHIISYWVSNAIRVDGTLYPVTDSAWHNIAVTYDGSSSANGVKIYVDGMEEVKSVYVDSLSGTIQTPESFKVGARSVGSGTTQHLEGTIDEVSVWDAALTQGQIQAQMYAPLQGNEANLVAAWNFDEAEGQIAHDLTGGDDAFLGSDPCNIDSADPIWVMPGAPAICAPLVEVALDIKPGGCPNPLNVKSKGVLPAAILGTQELDVTMIDPTSIRLAGVEPLRSSIEDVAAPVADGNECDCTTAGPDGYADLTLKFESQAIVEAIGEVNDGQIVPLTVTGVLTDETPIEGSDCVRVFGRYKPFNQADTNKDGVVDIADFAILAENWLKSSIIQD